MEQSLQTNIKIGTCGFPLPKAKLAERFAVVEVQQTFYQPPRISTLERWRSEVPEEFEFTIKAWQLITHTSTSPTYRRLRRSLDPVESGTCGSFRLSPIVEEAWQVTAASARALRAERVLFQCPASFRPTQENVANLRHFFHSIERHDLKLLWEPRGELWKDELVIELCNELDLQHVTDPFVRLPLTAGGWYLRLHGRGGYRYVYEDSELQELLEILPAEEANCVLFNNVAMLSDASRFQQIVKKANNP